MPRLLHQPPKYWLHKPSGQAVVKIDGRRRYLGKYGSPESHQRYAEAIAKWRSKQEASPQDDSAAAAVMRQVSSL